MSHAYQSKHNVGIPSAVSVEVPDGYVVTVQSTLEDPDGLPGSRQAPRVFIPERPGDFDLLLAPEVPDTVDVHVVPAHVQPKTSFPDPNGSPHTSN